MLVAAFWLVGAGLIFAQSGNVEKSRRVKTDEVPVLIQKRLQNDFNLISNEGIWSLQYLESRSGVNKTARLTPVGYVFRQKKDGNKIEIRFSSEGTLEHTKGIQKSGTPSSD